MHVQFCLAVLCCCTAAGLVDAWLPASAFTAQHVASRQAARCSTSKQSHTRVATAPSMMFDFSKFTWGKKPVTAAAALAAPTSPAALTGTFDVAVIGAGPGGAVMATLLSEKHGLRVVLIDPAIDKGWVPNYGVWLEEWHALDDLLDIGLRGCLSRTWPTTDCFYGGSHGLPESDRLRIERPYARVARDAMRSTLLQRMAAAGVTRVQAGVDAATVQHGPDSSTFQLSEQSGAAAEGVTVEARLIVDCSGHKSELVERDGPHDPGYQIAYGIECEIEGDLGPYDPDSMLFMDYRTSYVTAAERAAQLTKEPTFLYAMPLGRVGDAPFSPDPLTGADTSVGSSSRPGGKQRVFFEETSLVARPAVSMAECKQRLYERLGHHGIAVATVHEEEFCVIPMGGAYPRVDQRVVAFAGAGGLVHAATGYMQVRMLAASKPLADAIGAAFRRRAEGKAFDPDVVARKAYAAVWPAQARLQRDFHVFGGEFLMQQDVASLRGFFTAFFKMPLPYWAGFLSGYPGLPHNELHQSWPQRFWFGVQLWLEAPISVKTGLMVYGALQGLQLGLLRSVTPLSNAEVDKDTAFAAAMAAIDAAADAATAATTANAPTVGSASAAAKAKELVKS